MFDINVQFLVTDIQQLNISGLYFWHYICKFTMGVTVLMFLTLMKNLNKCNDISLILPLLFSSIREQACLRFILETLHNLHVNSSKPVIVRETFVKIVQVYYFVYLLSGWILTRYFIRYQTHAMWFPHRKLYGVSQVRKNAILSHHC